MVDKIDNFDGLIACPHCDLLHNIEDVQLGQKAKCARCHSTLISPKRESMDRTIALSIASVLLMICALSFPFLSMSRSGLSNEASIVEVILTFNQGFYVVLGLCVLLFVVAVPMLRTAFLVYAIWPLRNGRRPYRYAKRVFLWSETLRPWAMTEIFVIGTAVSLFKIGGLATVGFGEGFWLYCLLVLCIAFQDASVCRWTIWNAINGARA